MTQVESNNANVDDAIMLDKDGFVSETNATNLFMVKSVVVLTPHADYCLPGITRATVMELVVKENVTLEERNISLYGLQELWENSARYTHNLYSITEPAMFTINNAEKA
ncbi:hypothetical protein Bca52824_019666 [Brassica carinata]|uniref:Uncharacterized protein n=1 Tax=Brassica carinata TaxID=52824 RepID=A0A8X7VRT8_BRACI|nr:hypothetical protein Bca52824_019666 [Brassica carinata]